MVRRWDPRRLLRVRGSDQVILQRGRRLVMENCKQVIFCDPGKIVLKGCLLLTVTGDGLKLKELGNENVEIDGRIGMILLEEKP